MNLALNNQQRLICHKTQTSNQLLYICVCVCVCVIKMSGKGNKPTLITNSLILRSLLNKELHQNSEEVLFNVERNIIESVVCVGLFPFPLICIILSDLPKYTISPYIYIYIYKHPYCLKIINQYFDAEPKEKKKKTPTKLPKLIRRRAQYTK